MPDTHTQETTQATTDPAMDLARRCIYEFLAAVLSDPVRKHFEIALDRKVQGVAVAGAGLLGGEASTETELALGEHPPTQLDLRPIVEAIAKPRGDVIAQHQKLFGLLIAKTAPPYETEYCHTTLTFYRSQQLADIAGFYRAFGLEQSRDEPERQDHIAVELEFMAHLIERERSAARPSGNSSRPIWPGGLRLLRS
jgi:nitrate reductase delta subunit